MATTYQLFVFETEEEQVVFSPWLPNLCGKGPNVGEALQMWQMQAQQHQQQQKQLQQSNFNFLGEDDLNTSRKVWYGRSEKEGGVYIVDDETTDRGVAFCPQTGLCESFKW
eukprot:CAMPEP_0201522822 /NCGR_PEP_ID=MMETSP0161_2-20130828/18570_1 /ASSEMBLY_ACC=CAM_ASM_000251 /TAXON_ID=180227 /ORGANISM="Neoparamoeba aestuarina, Strain SoJaBio B1-5/56/2" /LENGTH=110 /DNA_ID=CAMNT_0047921763 /DNA_START=85 /DNA_END=414 /DNA_ORIENTATION=-